MENVASTGNRILLWQRDSGIPICRRPCPLEPESWKSKLMLYRLLVLTLVWPLTAFAQAAQVDPLTLPTRDTHQNLTVAADPYVSATATVKLYWQTSPYSRDCRHQCLLKNDGRLVQSASTPTEFS